MRISERYRRAGGPPSRDIGVFRKDYTANHGPSDAGRGAGRAVAAVARGGRGEARRQRRALPGLGPGATGGGGGDRGGPRPVAGGRRAGPRGGRILLGRGGRGG